MSHKDLIARIFRDSEYADNYSFTEEEFIEDFSNTITEREWLVLCHRFSMDGKEFLTLRALGSLMGVGQERIRQIESKALRKMMHPSRSWPIRNNVRMAYYVKRREENAKKAEQERSIDLAKMRKRLNIPIGDLELSVRSYNCLTNERYKTVGDLIDLHVKDFLKIPNFGRKSLRELVHVLREYDVTIKGYYGY